MCNFFFLDFCCDVNFFKFTSGLITQAETKILKGPHENLESYLEAIDQLRNNIHFFSNSKGFKSSEGVLNHSNNLLTKAISKLEDEFKNQLTSYRSVIPHLTVPIVMLQV